MVVDSVLAQKIKSLLWGEKESHDDTTSSNSFTTDSEFKDAQEQAERINALREPLISGGGDVEAPSVKNVKSVPWWRFWERSQFSLFMFILMCTEWGDVSQVVAIGLAAKNGMWSIILGGGVAHVLSIFIAIALGSVVNKFLSEKWMNLIAGMLFLGFAVMETLAAINGEAN